MCSSKGGMPDHLPSYTRSLYCPSAPRHDCQSPSSIALERSDSDVNWAPLNPGAAKHVPIATTTITRKLPRHRPMSNASRLLAVQGVRRLGATDAVNLCRSNGLRRAAALRPWRARRLAACYHVSGETLRVPARPLIRSFL